MRRLRRPFRLTALIAGASLVLAQVWPRPVFAQAAAPVAAGITPPARVGRLAWTEGSVSFRPAGQDGWSAAEVNYPVNAGDALWTQPGAAAGLEVSDTLIALASATELDLDRLDTTTLAATAPEGEVYVRIRSLLPGESDSLRTPRGTVSIAAPGRYEIVAGTTTGPTLVTVLQGVAQVAGPEALTVRAGQTAVISGDQTFSTQIVPAQHDAFLERMLARERPAPTPAVAPPPLVAAMPGGAELDEYGTWASSPDYGPVWYPRVAAGWVPYREGHWAYVAPWGWTWIDDDPWGFAPFHYGRWVEIGPRWAWVPVVVAVAPEAPPYPVYAPALVTFFDVGAGFAAGVAVGALLSGSVGWVPLGPYEPYRPCFRASPRYLREVNFHQVRRFGAIPAAPGRLDRFRNARAASLAPAAALATSRPLRGLARPVPAAELARARPVAGRAPLPPTTATLGVTPALARREHIAAPPAGLAAPARRVAPGPARRAEAGAARGLPRLAAPGGRASAVPAVRGAASRPAVSALRGEGRPGQPGALPGLRAPGTRPGAAGPGPERAAEHRPSAATPGLRAPGARPPGLGAGPPARPETHAQAHPGVSPGEARPGARPALPAAAGRPAHAGTPQAAEPRAPARLPAARPSFRPEAVRPAPRAETRPVPHPAYRPAPRPEARPAPPPRPEMRRAPSPRPETRPAPARRPEARPPARPAPERHDEHRPQ